MTNEFAPSISLEMLKLRSSMFRDIRAFFEMRGFLEVDTPVLSADVVIDRNLEPIGVHVAEVGWAGSNCDTLWMQTSPEFHMKRLLAVGAEAIFQISRVFRSGELGPMHNPEFSMLEWYRVGDNYRQGMELLGEFAMSVLGHSQCEYISYRDAFQRWAGCDPFDDHIETMVDAADRNGVDSSMLDHTADIDQWRDLLLVELVQPKLGTQNPTIVYDWPASQAALARIRHDEFPVAERFELFNQGIELANGYHELLDANELELRNRVTNEIRGLEGKRTLPEQSRLLPAMRSGIPACCGTAVGLDRLLMVLTQSTRIAEVMPFPLPIA